MILCYFKLFFSHLNIFNPRIYINYIKYRQRKERYSLMNKIMTFYLTESIFIFPLIKINF